MELHSLRTFLTVGCPEKSFPPIWPKSSSVPSPLSPYRFSALRAEMGEQLIDRLSKHITRPPPAKLFYEYAQRFEVLQGDLENSLSRAAGTNQAEPSPAIGANESSTVYLLDHIERFRAKYPKIRVQVRRSQSSRIPAALIDGELELGILTYDPEDERIVSEIIYSDHLAFIVSPKISLSQNAKNVTIEELGGETFIAHNVTSPYRGQVIRAFCRTTRSC